MTHDTTRCIVEVVTIEQGKPVVTKAIDHMNDSDRAWLAKHTFWAIRNKCNVLIRQGQNNR